MVVSGPANLRFSFTSRFLPFSEGRLDRTALRKLHLPSWSDPSSLLHSIFSCQKLLSEKEEGWKASCEKIFQDVHVEFCETWMKSDVKLKNFNVGTHTCYYCMLWAVSFEDGTSFILRRKEIWAGKWTVEEKCQLLQWKDRVHRNPINRKPHVRSFGSFYCSNERHCFVDINSKHSDLRRSVLECFAL